MVIQASATVNGTISATQTYIANSTGNSVIVPTSVTVQNSTSNVTIGIESININKAVTLVTFNSSTNVNSTANTVVIGLNPFNNGDYVVYLVAAGNTALTNLANNTSYYVVNRTSTTIQLSTSNAGTVIDLTAGVNETGHSLTYSPSGNLSVSTINTTSNGFFANSTVINLGNSTIVTSINSSTISTANLIATGYIIGAFSTSGSLIPTTNGTMDVGSQANTYRSVYTVNTFVSNVYALTSNVNFGSNTIFNSNTTINGTNTNITCNTTINGTITVNTAAQFITTTFTASGTAAQNFDTFDKTKFRSVDYFIQLSDTEDPLAFQSTRILVIQDGTNAPLITEYGTLVTKTTLGQFVGDISGSAGAEVRLRITPTVATVTGKFLRTVMVV